MNLKNRNTSTFHIMFHVYSVHELELCVLFSEALAHVLSNFTPGWWCCGLYLVHLF